MSARSEAAALASLLPLAPRDYLILFALVDGPLHGHGLLKRLETEANGVPFDPANLYRSLRKLERDALIVEAAAAAEGQGPPRRAYRLPRPGRAAPTGSPGSAAPRWWPKPPGSRPWPTPRGSRNWCRRDDRTARRTRSTHGRQREARGRDPLPRPAPQLSTRIS